MNRPSTYEGILDVADDAFTLQVEEFRLRANDRIDFVFKGEDEGGAFRCEGTAIYQGSFYVSPAVSVKSTRGGMAIIRFSKVHQQPEFCEVEGSWSQDGYIGSPWSVWGELDLKLPDNG